MNSNNEVKEILEMLNTLEAQALNAQTLVEKESILAIIEDKEEEINQRYSELFAKLSPANVGNNAKEDLEEMRQLLEVAGVAKEVKASIETSIQNFEKYEEQIAEEVEEYVDVEDISEDEIEDYIEVEDIPEDEMEDYIDVEDISEEEIEETIESSPKGRIGFIGDFFRRKAKEMQEEDFDYIDEEPKESFKTKLKRTGITAATVLIVGGLFLGGYKVYDNYKEEKLRKQKLEEELKEYEENYKKSLEKMKEVQELAKQKAEEAEKAKIDAQNTKEEEIVKLVQQLTDELNKYEGFNVTFEQSLALFIHLNVTNSYTDKENPYVLDAITRENLIKTYYVGLTKDSEEFESYTIDDADLSKLSAGVQELRNALVNRVIVLNDEKNYEESQEIIAIFKGFVTETELQDEVEELTTSIQNMQSSDKTQVKEEVYRYYNYIFAGPKSEVRNFDDYGHYTDENNKEMTYENQGSTMRFYTWFMDGLVSINLTNNLVPNDIINSKEAKLLDQATLLRMLGFKNCNAFDTYYISKYFDEAIDNRIKSNSKSTKKRSYAKATGDATLDSEIDQGLLNNSQVGSSFTTSNGSTVTVVESGPSSTTVVVEPDPNSAVTEDTTPDGPNEREETEGGGNEETEEIVFPEDPTEEIIDEGGEEIYNGAVEGQSSVESEEMSSDEASIRDEINELLYLRQMVLGEEIVPNAVVYIEEEKGYQKTLSC